MGEDFEQGEEVKGGEKTSLVEEEAMGDWLLQVPCFSGSDVRMSCMWGCVRGSLYRSHDL